MQMGFDLDYTDPVTQEKVTWAQPSAELFDEIEKAPWKVVDLETTGLNPASKEISFTGKDLRRGVNPTLRTRVISVLYPAAVPLGYKVASFDADQLLPDEKEQIAKASLTNAFIGHNAGFDLYWLRMLSKTTPSLVIDTMLLARVLRAEHPLEMARVCSDEQADEALRESAISMFKQGKSGWALDSLAANLLNKVVEKTMQGPKNWCEPFLSQKAYEYATGDVITTLEILKVLLNLEEGQDLLQRYFEIRQENRSVRIIEPQVFDVIRMRERGMPWDRKRASAYIKSQTEKVSALSKEMSSIEPSLAPYETEMGMLDKGISANLKQAVGAAFTARGVVLDMTSSTHAYKVGEKDLRRAKAGISEEAKVLFKAWVALNKAKKAAGMAKEVGGFASRSHDGLLHPNTGHGPVTGRLSSSEPNTQQFPRDQGFRDCVAAKPGFKILASDYSALDMRVGAALAIRAQREISEFYLGAGTRKPGTDVYRVVQRVYENKLTVEGSSKIYAAALKEFDLWKAKRDDDSKDAKSYWKRYRELSRSLLLAGFQHSLMRVMAKARETGAYEWSALRNAFSIPGMDIHTWTALGMKGLNPEKIFSGLSDSDVSAQLKVQKKALGPARDPGKVGNLSLLYAMKVPGLVEAAAKNYDIHWTLDQGAEVYHGWLNTYIEIDLWHKWTELNQVEAVYVPDPDFGGEFRKKGCFSSVTLGGRQIYAFGLNAALSYEDQSTGADILGRVMQTLYTEYPEIGKCIVNQVHDELVLEVPEEQAESYTKTVQSVMVQAAEHFLAPFGVRAECSPALGDVWLKD